MDDLGNRIGADGDRTAEPEPHGQPGHTSAAAKLLDRQPPDGYAAQWAAHFARPVQAAGRQTQSAVLFRIGGEWFALASAVVEEVAHPQPIHSIPHRRMRGIIGITNVRGELLVCVSLAIVLGAGPAGADPGGRDTARMLVLRRGAVHVVCPVDEVGGVIRFDPRTLTPLPGTLARAATRYSTHLLSWNDRDVGMLDDQLLLYTVGRSIA